MIKDLENLIKIGEIDKRIYELEKDRVNFPQEVKRLQGEIDEAQNLFLETKQKIEQFSKDQNTSLDEIDQKKGDLEKSQEKLKIISTNKEYDAVQIEIESHEINILKQEKMGVKLKDAIETLSASLSDLEEASQKVITENSSPLKKYRAALNSIQKKIDFQFEKRAKFKKQVSDKFIKLYERILKNRKNRDAMGLVTEAQNVCSFCHTLLASLEESEDSPCEFSDGDFSVASFFLEASFSSPSPLSSVASFSPEALFSSLSPLSSGASV